MPTPLTADESELGLAEVGRRATLHTLERNGGRGRRYAWLCEWLFEYRGRGPFNRQVGASLHRSGRGQPLQLQGRQLSSLSNELNVTAGQAFASS